MSDLNLVPLRLRNQRLLSTTFRQPAEVVGWLGAVQSQEFAQAKWALGQRMVEATDRLIEQAFDAGAILRTHVMRPTWHFVTPEDIRWLLALTKPRVHARNRLSYQQLALDEPLLRRCGELIADAVQGGNYRTRDEIGEMLTGAGIPAEGRRLAYIMHHAELEAVVCSGPRLGKQFTYALLDERVPPARAFDLAEARAALVLRYFRSRGPATLKDFRWWSGLSAAEARAGLEQVRSQLSREAMGDQIYWLAGSTSPERPSAPMAFLLPNYDEYIVGYTDRSAVFDAHEVPPADARGNLLYNHTILIDGLVVGTWKRAIQKDAVSVSCLPAHPLTPGEDQALEAAVRRYGEFLGLKGVKTTPA